MANIYDQNLKLQAIADAITNQSITITTGQDLLDALADIAAAMQPAAANITFDNTASGSVATNVQQAIDEDKAEISALNSSITTISSRKNLKSIDITDTNPISITGGSGNVVNYNNIVSAYAFTPSNATTLLYRHASGGVYARVVDVTTMQNVTGSCQVTVYYWE